MAINYKSMKSMGLTIGAGGAVMFIATSALADYTNGLKVEAGTASIGDLENLLLSFGLPGAGLSLATGAAIECYVRFRSRYSGNKEN